MKISKWAYSIEEGPIEPVYVYEAPVRFWHWAQCAAFFMLVITGFLIGWPPIANYATTWDTYFFGHIIMLHLVCGMLFAVLMLYLLGIRRQQVFPYDLHPSFLGYGMD
jgi:Ni/Fe-hydrogenase 1 B-type cytochrome subunit